MIEGKKRGFTLVEIMTVVAIISILSSISVSYIIEQKAKSRDFQRIQNILRVKVALSDYYRDNGHYPVTPGNKHSECAYIWGGASASGPDMDTIPGLVPKYINKIPGDPLLDCNGITHSWTYYSDGEDYKFVIHAEVPNPPVAPAMVDPGWDGGVDPCVQELNTGVVEHYAIWSPGVLLSSGSCWSFV